MGGNQSAPKDPSRDSPGRLARHETLLSSSDTPTQKGEHVIREETTTTTYEGGTKVVRTVITVKEGSSRETSADHVHTTTSPPPTSQAKASMHGATNNYTRFSLPPPTSHTKSSMHGATNSNTCISVPPPMYGYTAHEQRHVTYQQPQQQQHSNKQPSVDSYGRHRPPRNNKSQQRTRNTGTKSNMKEVKCPELSEKGKTEKLDTSINPDIRRESKPFESIEHSTQLFGPDANAVFDFMVKEMNGKGSPRNVQKKSGLFPESYNRSMVEEWFKCFPNMFRLILRNDRVSLVLVYIRDMTYCLDYISRISCNKDKCARYHVCKDMLCGYCIYEPSCKRSHDFLDSENDNVNITMRLGLSRFTNDQILVLMTCRYPHLCFEWSQPKGCKNNQCEKLHMCKKFLFKKCDKGDGCCLGHERTSKHNAPIIEAYGMTLWNDINFRRNIYIQRREDEDKNNDSKHESTNLVKRSEKGIAICDQHLLDNCYKVKCPLYHNDDLKLPYIWQIKTGDKWVSLPQSEDIEKEYCALVDHSEPTCVDVLKSGESEVIKIEFDQPMRAAMLTSDTYTDARRVSTQSYIEKGPVNNFRTQWRWFKRSAEGGFVQFSSDKLQQTLEEKYLSGQEEYQFLSEKLPFLDFGTMKICEDGNCTSVIRRPLIVTRNDVNLKKTPSSLPTPVYIPVLAPKGWTKWDSSAKVELVKLQRTSSEYKLVHEQFYSSIKEPKRSQLPIKHIFRIQNYTLWDQFCSKESSMKTTLQHTGGDESSLDKRYLFHGTDNFSAVKGICRENFDPRVSGKNATNFGDGAYFAKESFLAHQYTSSPDRFMFMVNVLVGDFTKGSGDYRKPPEKPGTDGEYFDSCVDNIEQPMKSIVFDRTQYYPEYLIWYEDECN